MPIVLNGTTGITTPDIDSTDAGLTNASITNPTVSNLNGGQLAGMRNRIINGKMEIAQRGTSFVSPASGAYGLDRWVHFQTSTSAFTISQQADVPSSNEFQNSLRVAVTTADTSIAAGDFFTINQAIEGYNVRDLIGRTFTLSFWVRSSKTGIHCIRLCNSISDRSYVAEYTINAANTWEFKTVTVSGGLITAGTWNWTNGVGLLVSWALATGSTFQTTAGAWQTGNFTATANQVNCLDSNTNIFALTGVQLEVGAAATPFEHRPFGTELALCQRYYHSLNYLANRPQFGPATQGWGWCTFPVTMRSGPTVTISGSWRQLPGGALVTTPVVSETSPQGFSWFTSNVTAMIQGADTGSPVAVAAIEL